MKIRIAGLILLASLAVATPVRAGGDTQRFLWTPYGCHAAGDVFICDDAISGPMPSIDPQEQARLVCLRHSEVATVQSPPESGITAHIRTYEPDFREACEALDAKIAKRDAEDAAQRRADDLKFVKTQAEGK